eukprot:gb/GEZN01004611.1/.p1 GENE.gb/GEZN01004611.1/~~gb/GEZN01004611.1/.p1  ORF type:complete len:610 (+),score=52.82 gb/GEZN01004611.1/:77-1906(+)
MQSIARLARVGRPLSTLSPRLSNQSHLSSQLRTFTAVAAHGGGSLKPLLVKTDPKDFKEEAIKLPSHTLTDRQLCDIELLLNGGFTPLNGFMNQKEYNSVVDTMRMPDGNLFPIPITLDLTKEEVKALEQSGKKSLTLLDMEGNVIAIIDVEDIFQPDKDKEAKEVFGGDPEHPAIDYLYKSAGSHYVGGKVRGLQLPPHYDHRDIRRTPTEVRKYFKDNNWTNVVAFQTRNPLHRAHFELTRRAMEEQNAKLLLHPVVGLTKPGDIGHHTRVRCYRRIMYRYPHGEALLSALPLAMRMAGPREAVWHAIVRKNYGASAFIVGRDHAGPGSNSKGVDFYGPYEARDFAVKHEKELGIKLCSFEMMVYLPDEQKYYPVDEVPKGKPVNKLSGTEVRRRLQTGEEIPEWFSFPEVVSILRLAHPPRAKQGFCVFFTGFSGSGKSTVANALIERLMEIDQRTICMLDGDHVRQMLSKGLGFSVEDRNLNIMRIGYVASEVVKPGGTAIAAPIAPFHSSRKYARTQVEKYGGFVEVHISTSIEECSKRDRKGLYKKAKLGLLKGLTGIDDPYEVPEKPELTIDCGTTSVLEAVDMIVKFLELEGYINMQKLTP